MEDKLRETTINLLRIATGVLYVPHGYGKLFGEQPPDFTTLWGIAGLLEFFGGLLIVAGLWTRPVAFVLSGQMAVAYWTSHAPRGAWPIDNGGELAILFCFIYLFLFANGAGAFSVDGWRGRRRA